MGTSGMVNKAYKGRAVLAGNCRGEALVSRQSFNTLASFQYSIVLRQKVAACADRNNPDIYRKVMTGKILCLPQTIGSTGAELVLQTIAKLGSGPLAMLFSNRIDPLAAAGVLLADIWQGKRIIVVDELGADFLEEVQTGQNLRVDEDGTVTEGLD
jgi:uncharacterized protein